MYLMYVWSFPFGFHGVAVFLFSSVLECSALYLFNRLELPAVANGVITIDNPRQIPTFVVPDRAS